MSDNHPRWSSPISAMVTLLLFALCAHQSLAQQIDFGIGGKNTGTSITWQGHTNTFNTLDGKSYSIEEFTKTLGAEKGGQKIFGMTPYSWFKFGNVAWVFGPDGNLYHCPTCAGSGEPGTVPPWHRQPKIIGTETTPFIVRAGPPEDGVYVTRHYNATSLTCIPLYYQSAVKSNWMECRK